MEELAMLRQLIGQLQDLFTLFGSHHQPFVELHHRNNNSNDNRWCALDINDGPTDDYCDIVMATGNSGNFKMLEPSKPPPSKKSRKDRTRPKSPTGQTETMDEQIWKQFPEDLFEPVIARLPIATFFRLRTVCQKWNSLLNSESFSQHCAQIPQSNPWFYTITHENINSGAMYDPSAQKWHHPAISSLPNKRILLPVASAGGLVCFIDIGHVNFYVSNPLTNSFKELPARSVKVWSRIAVAMTSAPSGGSYKIIWVCSDGEFEVYDSVQNSWVRPGGPIPGHIKLPLSLNFKSQAISIGETVYFMRTDPDGIISYNMVTGVWREYVIPAPSHVSDQALAESGGRVMLVGLLTKNTATCVGVWELQRMTLLWKEVDRMPNEWCLEFYGRHVRMTCLGNQGGMVMVSLRSRQMNRLVTYDVRTGEWVRVPGCLVPNGRKRQWIACGAAFHPCLTAVA